MDNFPEVSELAKAGTEILELSFQTSPPMNLLDLGAERRTPAFIIGKTRLILGDCKMREF